MVRGSYCQIECAIREDGSEPSSELLSVLAAQMWPDPDADELPDSYQAGILARLYAALEDVAAGEDPAEGMYNYLNEGMWEFKVSTLRLTFYDTDGAGSSTSIASDATTAWDGSAKHYLPEEFGLDGIVRLGHHFPKPRSVRRTPEADLKQAFVVREEDFSHDRE